MRFAGGILVIEKKLFKSKQLPNIGQKVHLKRNSTIELILNRPFSFLTKLKEPLNFLSNTTIPSKSTFRGPKTAFRNSKSFAEQGYEFSN